MRKPNLTTILAVLLVGSVSLNLLSAMRLYRPSAATQTLDNGLVASWKSVGPTGYRLIFVSSGQFVLTKSGVPYGPVGSWSASSGNLTITWAMDEDSPVPQTQVIPYLLTSDDQKLELRGSIFEQVKAKYFLRVRNDP